MKYTNKEEIERLFNDYVATQTGYVNIDINDWVMVARAAEPLVAISGDGNEPIEDQVAEAVEIVLEDYSPDSIKAVILVLEANPLDGLLIKEIAAVKEHIGKLNANMMKWGVQNSSTLVDKRGLKLFVFGEKR